MKIIYMLVIVGAFCVLAITPVQAAPIGGNDTAQVSAGQTVTIDVLANDTGSNLTIDLGNSAVVYPARKTDFAVVNNKLVYTNNPAENGDPINGQVTIYYILKDDANITNWAKATINIVAANNSQPVANDDVTNVTAGGSVTIDVLANDTGNNFVIDLGSSAVAYPARKTDFAVINNKLVYWNNSGVEGRPVTGLLNFYYVIRDQQNRTAWATLRINIIDTRGPPIGNNDTAEVSAGGSVNIDVLANDTGTNLSIQSASVAWPAETYQVRVEGNKLVYTHNNSGQASYANQVITIYYVVKDDVGRTNWATVTVNVVASAGIRTYILAGQSNAGGFGLGYGELPFGTLSPYENLDYVGRGDLKAAQPSGGIFSRYFSTWRDLEPGFGAGNGFRFGPELSFNSKLQWTINEPVRIIKHSAGGTTMFSDWQPNIENNTYSDLMKTIDRAKVAANGIGIKLDIKGVLWVQGEADSFGQETPQAYESKLNSFISGLRTDLNLPNLQVHIAQIPDSYVWAERQQIWAAQQAVADSDNKAFLVMSKDLELLIDDTYGGNLVHWSTRGNVKLGELFADSVLIADSLD